MSAGRYFVYATILSTFVLIVWGAYLTAGDFGQGCGQPSGNAISSDWPYCNGSLAVPNPSTPAGYAALIEYMHRTLSVLVGVVLVATVVAVSRMRPRPTKAFRALLLSGVLLLVQVGLGNIVVNTGLNAIWTAVHLGNAVALFGVMVVSGVLIRSEEKAGTY
ncbi:MAG: COX15/CtaA family protein [Nitrososphaerota archaeon]|nr:COX15/CtaA family protein [Nitrososphaerota archaeon]MDG6967216.1 COX15/CtaA family protein [Nitrososphaerota archaeon]MDG6978851.1 COX15/CtaA family protein [Nitrososphaerota archaeon]MDG7021376.1 COX15/CtaA family protein [Nitrososphaerota archaeon]MDG7022255.1 COX15/CtaA family protein [Nitrososphaerota archaeon]